MLPFSSLAVSEYKQYGPQTTPLANTNLPSNPSGDANSNQHEINLDTHNEFKEIGLGTELKASLKSDDDFDVNEYFARLQGTRYVSAPLNRKEDQNANLPVEENLEEINLNEPEKEEHSITADIAQNFSQLPTVLPQVASAVFSSFSNMLNLKRDVDRSPAYQDGFSGINEVNYNHYKEQEVPVSKSVPPPLPEPPLSGSSNYRITTRKKVYAQIPGLTGEAPTCNPAASPSSSYFTNITTNQITHTDIHKDFSQSPYYFTPEMRDSLPKTDPPHATPPKTEPIVLEEDIKAFPKPVLNTESTYNFFTPIQNVESSRNDVRTVNETFQANATAPIIPPPPMFSNRRDSQGSVGRTVLPPSIARRIAGNQPLIKTQASPLITHDNIFVPTFSDHNQDVSTNAPPMFYTPTYDGEFVSNPIQAAPQELPITKKTLPNENVPYSESVTAFPTISPPVTEFFIPSNEPSQETKIESNPVSEQPKVDALVLHSNPLENFSSSAFMQVPSQEQQVESKQEPLLPPKKSFDVANPPPQFFDPSSMNQPNVYNEISVSNVHQVPPKSIQEPPKMSGSVNYRMSKKRPQYYSGPIEGVGNISNNIKPTLNPVQSSFDSLQGPLFTPSQDPDISGNSSVAPPIHTDISTFSSAASTYGLPPAQPYQQDFNTAFDLSRPTTEYYDQPQTEAKSFGLLGSLKSKLSSIDINKIQNTVTTFFDPAYTGEPKDDQQGLAPYQSSRMDHAQDSSTFDIFVGSSNTTQPNFTSNYSSDYNIHQYNTQKPYYDQQTSNYSSWPTSNPVIENNFAGLNLDNTVDINFNSHINTIDTPFALPSLPISIIEKPSSLQAPIFSEDTKISNVSSVISVSNPLSFFSTPLEVSPSEILDDEIIESVTNVVLGPTPQPCEITAQENKRIEVSFQRNENTFKLFDPHPLLPCDKHFTPENTFTSKADILPVNKQQSSPSLVTKSSIGNLPPTSDFSFLEPVDNDAFLKYFEPAPNTSHLFDFTNQSIDLPSKESEINLIERKVAEIALHDSHEKSSEDLAENVSELNICETCREVNKHEEKSEVEDLTSQLIENITAPIQLLNPVGAGLPVCEHVPELSLTESASDPLEDIAQISENFIENIPIHSVTELLGDVTLDKSVPNYGFNTTDINDIIDTTSLTEHNYNLPDVSDQGLFQSELAENIPRNASDEIKAGLKNSLDELVLPPLPILPTAPVDDDNKSDESGLDVHSIEQDANKDFPIYEEFVIEPSETDDDKIEFMVREKSTEDLLPAVDTFTNRVERYKKMETVNDESHVTMATIPTSISPSLTMASYFDTGNYAVETYYKNSLYPRPEENLSTRIPPGFEKEFSKRFSSVTSTGFVEDHITHIPDTTTQTRLTPTITFTQTTQSDVTKISQTTTAVEPVSTIETQHTMPLDEPIRMDTDTERLPAFTNLTEHLKEIEESKSNTTEPKTSNELPDPKNFFTSDPGPSNKENDEYNSYNRLSSYFATPPKADNPKSFFELSQSQDHYRHATHTETHNNNMKLIHDLAMYRDKAPIEIVRTINYFTVEYDNHSIESIGDPYKTNDIEKMPLDIVKKCKNCSNFNVGCVKKLQLEYANLKIKKYMDNQDQKAEVNMDVGSETHAQNVTVNLMEHSVKENDDGIAILTENRPTSEYSPVKYYWFYRVDNDGQSTWRGFSVADSRALEIAFNSSDLNENTLVPTDGGRYDVNIIGRIRMPVYWSEKPTNVRRCSWFYCNTDGRYVPYAEAVAEKLEVEYQHGMATGEWHRRLILPNNELVVMHGPGVMVHFLQNSVDSFSGSPLFNFGKTVYRNPPKIGVTGDQTQKIDHLVFLVHGAGEYRHQKERLQSMTRPRVVKRGAVESEIEDTEPSSIDHLLLLCHGVGSACDMRMRPVEAVVDDFRKTSMQLLQSHYKNSCDSGLVGRVEVLPISWHSSLHSGETGVDKRLANVTLDSIPWLRNFTNDTVLDVLFYTSPVFGQTIIDTVCKELNRIYGLFKKRNPDFRGGVSLGGHSLGSVILYDLLGHQIPEASASNGSTEKNYVQECAGTGQPMFKYPKLEFCPEAMFALGSPIAIFECVRGVEMLGKDFCLPTCGKFFNIFHPYDPIAYRIEPMINPELRQIKPYLIPHHKGRKRMHLELKETMARVGADIKQKLVESIKSTWFSMWKTAPPPTDQLEKVVEEEMEKEELNDECKEDVTQDKEATPEMLGRLNSGRRIDYVLQEAPFEMINEYLFAMTSHVCYWESADTILLILREVYASMRVQPDCCVPQNNLTVQRTRIVTTDGMVASTLDSPSTSRGSPC
ncbi:uncharacterized protein LOC123714990 isoform X1 [Pieris brassicae]|uniref:uncharacterized protein LOC123714990 isoform X1 n=2 Tax=Pieris brassicae TaxID=7116 RepID=UPI001E6623D5|nr:uncharacterized protein LOC123714990 isoform X1 [Pieris brassicae]